jgi:dTDP-4-dehydrorhamnose 3,5-epimerase
MNVLETPLPGLLIFEPRRFSDNRGLFMETFNERIMGQYGLPAHWPQDNFSLSHRNVVRGLHYQIENAQGKLVRVLFGAAWDVAVDLRRSSPTFGKHFALTLHGNEGRMLWIPPGFAHGFAALTPEVGFAYKVTDFYSAAHERTVLWNDPDLGIPWPIAEPDAVLSEKDRAACRFVDAECFA